MRHHYLGVAVAGVLMEELTCLVPIIVQLLFHVLSEEALGRVPMVTAATAVFFFGHGCNKSFSLVKGLLNRLLSDQTLKKLLIEFERA